MGTVRGVSGVKPCWVGLHCVVPGAGLRQRFRFLRLPPLPETGPYHAAVTSLRATPASASPVLGWWVFAILPSSRDVTEPRFHTCSATSHQPRHTPASIKKSSRSHFISLCVYMFHDAHGRGKSAACSCGLSPVTLWVPGTKRWSGLAAKTHTLQATSAARSHALYPDKIILCSSCWPETQSNPAETSGETRLQVCTANHIPHCVSSPGHTQSMLRKHKGAGEATRCTKETQQIECDSQDPHGGRKEPTPTNVITGFMVGYRARPNNKYISS